MKIIVYHSSYDCDTGCCGHIIEDSDGGHDFEFKHPYNDDYRRFAEELVRSVYGEAHVKDLDWENCIIHDD